MLNTLKDHGNALTHTDAHRTQRVAPAASVQFVARGQRQSGTAHSQRVAQRNRATVRVDVRGIIRQAQLTQHAQRLRGESFVKLDNVHIVNAEPGALQHLAGGRDRPSPIRRGSTPAVAIATIRVRGTSPCASAIFSLATISAAAPSLTPEAFPAVIAPFLRNGVLSPASCSSVVSARGCSSAQNSVTAPFFARHRYRHNLQRQNAVLLRLRGTLLAAQRERVLIGTADI